jgi:2-iminobutanoate/2-iminopropanoate deaminase
MKTVKTPKAPKPIGPYSQGIVANGFVFTAGVVALDPGTGKIVVGGIKDQTKRVLQSIQAILEEAGSRLDKVVKATVYLKERELFAGMNEVYSEYFTNHKPARSTIVCDFMREDVLVEIDAIAKV